MLPQGSKFSLVLWFVLQVIALNINAQNIITTVAGNGTQGYSGDNGPALSAQLNQPVGLLFDTLNNLYITCGGHVVRKVDGANLITTIAGTGVQGSTGDGGIATMAELNSPVGIILDDSSNLLIAEQHGEKIRKINNAGIISTFAGTDFAGYGGDNGPAATAQFYTLGGIAADKTGNVYVTDLVNSRVRKINSSGIITTIAGNGTYGYSGDNGQATLAQLNGPYGITLDDFGYIYFSDAYNNTVRKIDSSGIISTVAGTGMAGYSGDGGPATSAKLNSPIGLALDNIGNLYIADTHNNVVRKVDALTGIITTIAGTGSQGYSGDGGIPTSAKLFEPGGLTFDKNGNLFISDVGNNVIRKVTNVTGTNEIKKPKIVLDIYPNPNNGNFIINFEGRGNALTIEVYSSIGSLIFSKHNSIENYQLATEITNLNEGLYIVKFSVDGIPVKSQRVVVTK